MCAEGRKFRSGFLDSGTIASVVFLMSPWVLPPSSPTPGAGDRAQGLVYAGQTLQAFNNKTILAGTVVPDAQETK